MILLGKRRFGPPFTPPREFKHCLVEFGPPSLRLCVESSHARRKKKAQSISQVPTILLETNDVDPVVLRKNGTKVENDKILVHRNLRVHLQYILEEVQGLSPGNGVKFCALVRGRELETCEILTIRFWYEDIFLHESKVKVGNLYAVPSSSTKLHRCIFFSVWILYGLRGSTYWDPRKSIGNGEA